MSYKNVPISLYKNPFSPRTSSFKSPLLQPLTTALTLTLNFISLSSSPVFSGQPTLLTLKHSLNHYSSTISPSHLFSILFIPNAFFLTHSSSPFILCFCSLFPIGFFFYDPPMAEPVTEPKALPEPEKKKEQSLPFHQLFSFADKYDWFLMILGSFGAIIHGSSMPVFFLLFGEMVNGFGKNQSNFHKMTAEVSKVFSISTQFLSFTILLSL